MSATCKIEINQSVYQPGTIIEGKIVCTFFKSGSHREIEVTLKGEEHTHGRYLDPTGDYIPLREVGHARNHSRKITFLLIEHTLAKAESFKHGQYSFPFAFELPKNIPGSYIHGRGWIKFFIEAIVYQGNVAECSEVEELNVVSPIDLNLVKSDFDLGPTCERTAKHDTSLCCFNSLGPIVMTVQVPKRAFVQGESVAVIVDISNMLNEEVRSVELKVEQAIEVQIPLHIHPDKEYQLLFTNTQAGCPARSEETYIFDVLIPKHVDVPNFSVCKLFSKTCWIEITALAFSLDLKLTIPIVIGQIPRQKLEKRTIPRGSLASLPRKNAMEQHSMGQQATFQEILPQNDNSVYVHSPPSAPTRFPIEDEPLLPAATLYPPELPTAPRPLLPSKGPAPYSSYKQRPTGFAVPKPFIPAQKLPVPKPLDGPIPVPSLNSAEAYPPVAGPSMPLPERVPPGSPPSYESIYGKPNQSRLLSFGEDSPQSPSTYETNFVTAKSTVSTSKTSSKVSSMSVRNSGSYSPETTEHSNGTPSPSAPLPPTPVEPYPPPLSSAAFPPMPFPHSELYPPESQPPASFTPMPMPMPFGTSAPYPSENTPSSSASDTYPPVSLPSAILYPPSSVPSTSFPSMPLASAAPYPPDNSVSGWNLIRSAVPKVVASHRPASNNSVSRAAPYPPENPPPSESSVGFSHYSVSTTSTLFPTSLAPMPDDGLYPPPRDKLSARPSVPSGSTPYPKEPSPPKCDRIGFAVMENNE